MKKFFGFNLIELLVVLTIIGILSALCFPLYSQHIVHEKRLEAEIMLEKLASALEQYYTIHNSYKGATLEQLNIPAIIVNNNYQLAITSTNDTDFFIQATPLNQQAQNDNACATLSLDSQGEKKISGAGSVSDCW